MGLVSLIKRVTLKQSETKYRTYNYTQPGAQTHNNVHSFHLWDAGASGSSVIWPGQGTSDADRIGDSLFAVGIKLRMYFQIPSNRKNVTIKLWYLPYNSTQGDPTTYNDFFHNKTGIGLIDPVQTKRYPMLRYIGKFRLYSRDVTDSADGSILVNKWIPIGRNINFNQDISYLPSNLPENGRILYLAYDTYTTVATDNVISRASMAATLYFKDV